MTSVTVGDVAANVAEGLPSGLYLGQVLIEGGYPGETPVALVSYGVLPGRAEDAFHVPHLATIEFQAGMDPEGDEACWVRPTGPNLTVRVVRRKVA